MKGERLKFSIIALILICILVAASIFTYLNLKLSGDDLSDFNEFEQAKPISEATDVLYNNADINSHNYTASNEEDDLVPDELRLDEAVDCFNQIITEYTEVVSVEFEEEATYNEQGVDKTVFSVKVNGDRWYIYCYNSKAYALKE